MSGLEMKYFVLKPKGDDAYALASRKAMLAYARAIIGENKILAEDLRKWAKEAAAGQEGAMEVITAQTVKDQMPKRHEKHLVMREGHIFTATPCYGMHSPWWVVKTMNGEDAPVPMLDTDQHLPLNDAVLLYHKDAKAEADAEIERLKSKLRELSNIAHATHKKSDYYEMIENLKLIEHEANIFSL